VGHKARFRYFAPLAIATALTSLPCMAADSVRVRFETFDCVSCSDEVSELRIERPDSPDAEGSQQVDKYFQLVESILRGGNVSPKWNPGMTLHSDTITVEVSLGKQSYHWRLGWRHGEIPAPVGEAEVDRRQRLAVTEIIQASTRHLVDRLSTESDN